MYNRGPFAEWVPKPLMLLLIIVFMFPILAVVGMFNNNLTETVGMMGAYTEHATMAINATSIGMALALPLLMRIKMRFRSKEIMVASTILLALLVLMCGTTDNYAVFIICNLLIGFVKMFPMIEVVIPVMFILSPTGDRARYYSLFYPIAIGSSTLISYYLSQLIFDNGITHVYFLSAAVMLVLTVLSLIFQHNKRFSFKMPLYQIDWLSLLLLAASFMLLNYGLVFMKQQNWFHSPTISGSILIAVVLFILMVVRQKSLKRPLVHFDAFLKYGNVQHSLILLVFLGLYMGSSNVFMQWVMGVLGYNNLVVAKLNLWMLPGLVFGGALGVIGFKRQWNIKYYIWMGYVAFFLHTLLIYLIIQPNMNIEMLYLPTIIKGVGMVILFIAVWYYATFNLPSNTSLGVIGILLCFRTFIATGIASAVVGFLAYQMQWQSLQDMSNYWDVSLMGPEAMSGYGTAQMSALLASGKTLLGWFCWLIVPVTVVIFAHSYGRMNFRKWVLLRKLVTGNSIKGYRLNVR